MIGWLYRRLLVVVFTSVILGQSIKMGKVCLTLGVKSYVTYTCESHQMIHVISKLYQEASEACDVIDDACQVQEDDQSNGFTTGCNGKTQCTDELSTFRINKTCGNISNSLATVLYECVNDQPIDVCSNTATSSGVENILHLKSPNFPAASFGIYTCDCDVTGTDISVQILEMRFAFDVRMQDNIPVLIAKANLTLTSDTASWMSYPSIHICNTEVIDRTSHFSVMFDANGTTGNLFWIRLNGASTLNIKCNDGLSTTTESPRTVSPKTITSVTKSPTEGIPSTSTDKLACNVSAVSTSLSSSGTPMLSRNPDDNLNTTIIGALSGVIAILLLVVAALIIYFKCVKPRRLSTTTLASEDIEPHYEVGSDNQGVVSQPSENETQNIPDSSQSDYSDMRHYSNMYNVYTGLEPQGDYPEELPNIDDSYSHLQTNVNDDTTHGYSGLK